jgi:hypothetical protein
VLTFVFPSDSLLNVYRLLCCNSVGISLIGAFNLVYYEIEAIISSAFTLVCMYYWYRDSVDLYNWFKWTDADEANDFSSDRVMRTDATGRVYSDDLAKNGIVHSSYWYLMCCLVRSYCCLLRVNSVDPISMVNRRMEEDDRREKLAWRFRDDEEDARTKKSYR